MLQYELIAKTTYKGFDVIVDRRPDDLPLEDSFDTEVDENGKPIWDFDKMYEQLRNGETEWFVLRVRLFVDSLEVGSAFLGGNLYDADRVSDVMTDGVVDDMLVSAFDEAMQEYEYLQSKIEKFSKLVDSDQE